jgi:hypothetical protein
MDQPRKESLDIGADSGRESVAMSDQSLSEEAELKKAAAELGINFRGDDASGTDLPDAEAAKAAAELGISFRDGEESGQASDLADSEAAKAAQELGISFRDQNMTVKGKNKSTMARFWPVILFVGLAAILLPVLAFVLPMFTGG